MRKPNEQVTIYALLYPSNGTVFYVGQTSGDLEKRLHSHVAQAKKDDKNGDYHLAKTCVILEILSKGRYPYILELKTVSARNANIVEQLIIEVFDIVSHNGGLANVVRREPSL